MYSYAIVVLLFGVYAFERRRFKWIDGNHENEREGRQQRTRSRRKSADETQEAKKGGTTGSVAYGEVFFATWGTISGILRVAEMGMA